MNVQPLRNRLKLMVDSLKPDAVPGRPDDWIDPLAVPFVLISLQLWFEILFGHDPLVLIIGGSFLIFIRGLRRRLNELEALIRSKD